LTSAVAVHVTAHALSVWLDNWIAAGGTNLAFVPRTQRRDGWWLCAADGRDSFIANIHTCFALRNLAKSLEQTRLCQLGDSLVSGYAFCETTLLGCGGLPESLAVTQRLSLGRREL
jgi:hypothetical protein